MTKTLELLQSDIISEAKKGYPILLAGCIVFLLFTFLPFIFPNEICFFNLDFWLERDFPVWNPPK